MNGLNELPALCGLNAEPILVLTPKAGGPVAKAFSKIELGFDKKLAVRTIKLVENNGDEKEIVFTRVEKNGPLPPGAFR